MYSNAYPNIHISTQTDNVNGDQNFNTPNFSTVENESSNEKGKKYVLDKNNECLNVKSIDKCDQNSMNGNVFH